MAAFSLKVLLTDNQVKSSVAGDWWERTAKSVYLVMKTGEIQGTWELGLVHIVLRKLEACLCSINKWKQ